MKHAKTHFEQNIIRVKNLGLIYQSINAQSRQIYDLSDILRSQYVMLVSALDLFVHEIVRLGMIEIYNHKRRTTKRFKDFILSLPDNILFEKAIMEEKNHLWLHYQIRQRNGFKSFQESDKIKEALYLILEEDIWVEVRQDLGSEITTELNLIIKRRNQISHEADIEPINQELREVREEDIVYSIVLIESIVNKIFKICNRTHS